MPPTHPSQADVAAAYRTLIAHETEPKEQDFYRTRLQRLEQATESVCEFDCRSRVAAAGVGVYCPQCSAKSADTDLATQLAKAMLEDFYGPDTWDEDDHSSFKEHARAALEFLAGRLIPAGGMALTAEQVEDVRTVVSADAAAWNRLSPALFAAYRLRRALFPATEPAEPAIQSAGGDCFDVCEGHPAPAEPAEEETKAELPTEVGDRIRASVTRWSSALEWPDSNPYIDTFVLSSSGFWDAENDQFTVVPSCFSYIEVLEVLPSPVVPAPTETGPRYCSSCKLNVPPAPYCTNCGGDTIPRSPTETELWQTWQEVPDDTPFWSRDKRETNSWWWITRTTEHRKELRQADACGETVHLGPTSFMNDFAPFVAAEG